MFEDNQKFEGALYLKSDIKIEPLVCGWYAWPHLISPAQLAMNIKYRFLPLMQSFIANPAVHIAATNDPKLFGGPFVSLSLEDVPKVKKLLDSTIEQQAHLIKLAEDFKDLDIDLQEDATGFSLNEFYDQLPESLQGLIEFIYDTNNNASIRIFEELLYADNISEHTQEILMHSAGERDRHFFMSTPRLQTPDNLIFDIKFSDKRLDDLYSMRTQPGSFEDIARLLAVSEENMATFRNFFTDIPPSSNHNGNYAGDDVRVRYFGHACVLVQTSKTSILFDPTFALERHDDGRMIFDDLPDYIDYVVLTHGHQDHCVPEMLLQLRHRVGRIVVPRNNGGSITDPSLKLILTQLGYSSIDVLDTADSISLPEGEIVSLPFTGEHCDLNIYTKHSIYLTLKGKKFLFLVDSDGRDPVLYRRLMKKIKSVDALFLGMECDGAPLTWLYEPLLTKSISRKNNDSRRLSGANCERAWNVCKEIKPPRVFIYAMGQEPWMRHIMGLEYTPESIQLKESNKFMDLCHEVGTEAERLFISREIIFTTDTPTAVLSE